MVKRILFKDNTEKVKTFKETMSKLFSIVFAIDLIYKKMCIYLYIFSDLGELTL